MKNPMEVDKQLLGSGAVGDLLSSAFGDNPDRRYSDGERKEIVARIQNVIDSINVFRKENKLSSPLNQYAIANDLLDVSLVDMDWMALPFDFHSLPLSYPAPAIASCDKPMRDFKLVRLEEVKVGQQMI